jgi:CO/xanthine dehydrogenase FAD-binding subunit
VKPPDFDYHRPDSLAEALDLLAGLGDDVKVLAGGQSLVPMMNFRLVWPAALVDVAGVPGLAGVRRDNGTLAVGAMTRQWDAEHDPLVHQHCPVLAEALGFVGHTAIRTRGTVGGSLAHADPAAELPVTAVALGAEMVMATGSPERRRTVPAEKFFVHHFTTALAEDDLLVEVRWPVTGPGRGAALCEFALRHGDFAVVAAAAAVSVSGGICSDVRLAVGGVAPTPVRIPEAEAVLAGSVAEPATLAAAAEAAAAGVEPTGDLTAPAGYRRHLVRHLTEQALVTATERAARP